MKFKCKQSGSILEFKEPGDIESMLKEPHYEVVEETQVKVEKVEKVKKEAK